MKLHESGGDAFPDAMHAVRWPVSYARRARAFHAPQDNRLLAALPQDSFRALLPSLEAVDLPRDTTLFEPWQPTRHVYFPTTGMVCLVSVLQSGDSSGLAVTGREGVVGLTVCMSGMSTPARAVVVTAGSAYRIRAPVFRQVFNNCTTLQHLMLRYAQAMIAQMGQMAMCNRFHSIQQQLCRLLLSSVDRQGSNKVAMTHEQIGELLGVRRVSVTEAVTRLRDFGVIDCGRGRITVRDADALAARACECHGIVKREHERLFG